MKQKTKDGIGRATVMVGSLLVALILVTGVAFTASPRDVEVRVIQQQDLDDIPGKEAVVLEVKYPPGAADPVHRHNAHGFLYVLEGSVVMGVRGGKEVTLRPGQTFYEEPMDTHTIGRNASASKPARFLVFLVKDRGAEIFIPEPH